MRERATVCVIDQDEVLLIHRFKNGAEYYAVPGGGIEPGENEERAAVREMREETGLDVTLGEKIGMIDLDGERQHIYVARSFQGEPKLGGPELERQSPENIYKLEWIAIEDVREIDMREEIRELLLRHLGVL